MEEQHQVDDQSHYEISLTAGQAFVAFVLLMLSLAATFAFGLMIGKGQADERLVVRKDTPVVTEAALVPKKVSGRIVELGVSDDDFQPAADSAATTEPATTAPIVNEEPPTTATGGDALTDVTEPAPATPAAAPASVPAAAATPGVPHMAQLLSTSDQKTAETLAAKLIDRGFTSAYVERGATDKGPVFRVRVKFPSESEARSAEPRLKEFSKEVWITAR